MRLWQPVIAILFLALCQAQDDDTVCTTPTAPPSASCKNGGVPKEGDAPPCDCPPLWTGSDCGKIQCTNGGYPGIAKEDCFTRPVCVCPSGYHGIHCDPVRASSQPSGKGDYSKPSFNLFFFQTLTDFYGFHAWEKLKGAMKNDALLKEYSNSASSFYDSIHIISRQNNGSAVTSKTCSNISSADCLPEPKRPSEYECKPISSFFRDLYQELIKSNIRRSSLFIFTQFPPEGNESDEKILREYLIAFGIRLIVIVPTDDIFLNCDTTVFDSLRQLAHATDGHFVTVEFEDDDGETDNELLKFLVASAANQQKIAHIASADCSMSQGLHFNRIVVDYIPRTYYLAVRLRDHETSEDELPAVSSTVNCGSPANLTAFAASKNNDVQIFQFVAGASQECDVSVQVEGSCAAEIFSVAADSRATSPTGLSLLYSFVHDPDFDSGRTKPRRGSSFHLSLNVTAQGLITNSKITNISAYFVTEDANEHRVVEMIPRGHPGAFEWISSLPFACDVSTGWLKLIITSEHLFYRSIPILCEQSSSPHLVPSSLSDASDWLFLPDSSEDALTCEIFQSAAPPAFAILYSNELKLNQYTDFAVRLTKDDLLKKFSQYGSELFDAANTPSFMKANTKELFWQNIHDNPAVPKQSPTTSYDFAINTIDIEQNGVVSVAIAILPQNNSKPAKETELVNNGVKMVYWLDSRVSAPTPLQSLRPLLRLAAQSGGHVIVMDQAAADEDGTRYYAKALTEIHMNALSNHLLAAVNIPVNQPVFLNSIPNLDLTGFEKGTELSLFITATLNFDKPSSAIAPAMFSLVFSGDSGNQTNSTVLEAFTHACNLLRGTINLVGGVNYKVDATVLLGTQTIDTIHLRYWRQRNSTEPSKDPRIQVAHHNFEKKIISPNTHEGAAARLTLSGAVASEISLTVLDCAGNVAPKLDNEQWGVLRNGTTCVDGYFVPYFCDVDQPAQFNTTCVEGTESLYTLQFKASTSDGPLTFSRQFLCAQGHESEKNCSESGKEKNVFCDAKDPPFYRGPSKKLLDCSSSGTVKYDLEGGTETNGYKCNCNPGSTGVSCQTTSCVTDALPTGTLDTTIRTLTVLFLHPTSEESCSFLSQSLESAKASLVKDDETFENIWQFSLTVVLDNGQTIPVYRGRSYANFSESFHQDVTYSDDICPEQGADPPLFNISTIFGEATRSLGRDAHGLLILYQSGVYDMVAENATFTVDDSFYRKAQLYRQKVVAVTVSTTSEEDPVYGAPTIALMNATSATGGFSVAVADGGDPDGDKELQTHFAANLSLLVKGEIGYHAIKIISYSYLQDIVHTADQDAMLIASSTTNLDPTNVVINNKNENAVKFSRYSKSYTLSKDETYKIVISEENSDVQLTVVTYGTASQIALLPRDGKPESSNDAVAVYNSGKAVKISLLNAPNTTESVDDNWRKAERVNCTFRSEFVPFTNKFGGVGPAVVDFKVNGTYALAVPLAVSDGIDCVHGAYDNELGYCNCTEKFSGAACTVPHCEDGGLLNTWRDACVY